LLKGGTYFTVGVYEEENEWGVGYLAAAINNNPPDWENGIWFIVHKKDMWRVALEKTPEFNKLFDQFPVIFQNRIVPIYEEAPALGSYLFPWDKSQQWQYTQSWHEGNSLDFAPYNVSSNNIWTLSSSSGIASLYCGDNYQAFVKVTIGSETLTYFHVDYNSFVSQNIKDKSISQGQALGLLYNGTQGEGWYDLSQPWPWPSCTQGSSPDCIHLQYKTACGGGTAAHLHWVLPSQSVAVDGWQVDSSGIWMKDGQTKNVDSLFSSTNSMLGGGMGILYATSGTDLWQINPYTGAGSIISPMNYQTTDIAFDGKTLYGVTFSQLLSIDPSTGASSIVGNIGYSDVNALTVGPNGILYAGRGSGALLTINKSTGTGTLVGYYGSGVSSSGDLAVLYGNKMYASVIRSGYSTDWLAQINMNTGSATLIGNMGESGVYGLDFIDGNLYGVTSSGYLLKINITTGKTTRISAYSANFWGLSTSKLAPTVNYSSAALDGWILESTETSGLGGTLNSTATTFRLGDDAAKKQYRGVLSFNTGASLPDNAVITKATLKIKKQGIIGGGNPVTMFQGFMVDIKKGFFGTAVLQIADFQTTASKTYGPFVTALSSGWYSIDLTSGKAYINKLSTLSGLTQIRLRFKLDDNNNAIANYLSLFSGNAPAASRPQLIVEYYVP
jgi:hypothetical protein